MSPGSFRKTVGAHVLRFRRISMVLMTPPLTGSWLSIITTPNRRAGSDGELSAARVAGSDKDPPFPRHRSLVTGQRATFLWHGGGKAVSCGGWQRPGVL